MNASESPIQCMIFANDREVQHALEGIAKTCAIDLELAHPIITTRRLAPRVEGARIALAIPWEVAISHDRVWKLASRIASFCPQARVSAEVTPLPLAC